MYPNPPQEKQQSGAEDNKVDGCPPETTLYSSASSLLPKLSSPSSSFTPSEKGKPLSFKDRQKRDVSTILRGGHRPPPPPSATQLPQLSTSATLHSSSASQPPIAAPPVVAGNDQPTHCTNASPPAQAAVGSSAAPTPSPPLMPPLSPSSDGQPSLPIAALGPSTWESGRSRQKLSFKDRQRSSAVGAAAGKRFAPSSIFPTAATSATSSATQSPSSPLPTSSKTTLTESPVSAAPTQLPLTKKAEAGAAAPLACRIGAGIAPPPLHDFSSPSAASAEKETTTPVHSAASLGPSAPLIIHAFPGEDRQLTPTNHYSSAPLSSSPPLETLSIDGYPTVLLEGRPAPRSRRPSHYECSTPLVSDQSSVQPPVGEEGANSLSCLPHASAMRLFTGSQHVPFTTAVSMISTSHPAAMTTGRSATDDSDVDVDDSHGGDSSREGGSNRAVRVRRTRHHRSGSREAPAPYQDTVPPSPAQLFTSLQNTSSAITDRWRQRHHSQRPLLSSSVSQSDVLAQTIGGTRRRHHRDKMLQPDLQTSVTPQTSRPSRTGIRSGSGEASSDSNSTSTHHHRSHTIDNFALYAVRRRTPSTTASTQQLISPSSRGRESEGLQTFPVSPATMDTTSAEADWGLQTHPRRPYAIATILPTRSMPSTASQLLGNASLAGSVSPYGDIEDLSVTVPSQRLCDDLEGTTINPLSSTYGGCGASNAELRMRRRRSSFSSLHYGTMTGYRNEASRRRRGQRRKRFSGEESTRDIGQSELFTDADPSNLDWPSLSLEQPVEDDLETVQEQKGSVEEEEREPDGGAAGAAVVAAAGGGGVVYPIGKTLLSVAIDEDGEPQRCGIGLWYSMEHVFIPKYARVPEEGVTAALCDAASPAPMEEVEVVGETGQHSPTSDESSCHHHGKEWDQNWVSPKSTTSSAAAHLPQPMSLAEYGCTATSEQSSPTVMAAPGRSSLVVLPDADGAKPSPLSFNKQRRSKAAETTAHRLRPQQFSFGTVASDYNMDPVDEDQLPNGGADAKIAARLVFEADKGVMLMDPDDEVMRYAPPTSTFSEKAMEEEELEEAATSEGSITGEGACECSMNFIQKDYRGADCSRYGAHDLYDHCTRCHRRPAAFLCLHCMEAVCPSHVRRHHLLHPSACTLFLNVLDIMSSFDRLFWCELCQKFTWKYTDVYDALVDQIAYTRGTYLRTPARDIHCVGYEFRLKDTMALLAKERHLQQQQQQQHSNGTGQNSACHAHSASVSSICATGWPHLTDLSASPDAMSPVQSPPTAAAAATSTPLPLAPLSPQRDPLLRDELSLIAGNAVTVGEPVSKLCAIGASVQGWRTTQEDAEAVFLVDIPALSGEMASRKPSQHCIKGLRQRETSIPAAAAAGPQCSDLISTELSLANSTLIPHCDETQPRHGEVAENGVADDGAKQKGAVTGDVEQNSHIDSKSRVPTEPGLQPGSTHDAASASLRDTIPMAVFCMFDGHGGDAVAKLAARHFETHLRQAIASTRPDDVRARALLFQLNTESSVSVSSPKVTSAGVPVVTGQPDEGVASLSRPFASPSSNLEPLQEGQSCKMSESLPEWRPKSAPLNREVGSNRIRVNAAESVPADTLNLARTPPLVSHVTEELLRRHTELNAAAEVTMDLASLGADDRKGGDCSGRGMARRRRSGQGLEAWDAMEETEIPNAGVATNHGGAAVAPTPLCEEDVRRRSLTSVSTSHASPSPLMRVTIPEMEMLRSYFASIMEDTLLSLDEFLATTIEGKRGDYNCVGCTACVVGITSNFVLCANIGDSGAAFYTRDGIQVISVKHRLSDEAEVARIHAAGYAIINDRIEGMSAVPRALGDFDFKQCGGRGPREQAVVAVPDVTIMPVPSDTDHWGLVLACDGVWDTATLRQVHVALTNTVNDLDVAASATEAVLRGKDLYQHHLRGPAPFLNDSPSASLSQQQLQRNHRRSDPSVGVHSNSRVSFLASAASPSEGSLIGDYGTDAEADPAILPEIDAMLLTAAAGVFAQCVAPEDNEEGIGLDNCSLIIVERRSLLNP